MKHGILYKLGAFSCVAFALLLLCGSVSASEITQEEIDSYSQGVIEDAEIVEETPVENTATDELDPVDDQTVYTAENPLYVSVTTDTSLGTDTLDLSSDDVSATGNDGIATLSLEAPVTSDNTDGLKSALLAVVGSYDPIIATYTNNNGYVSYEVQIDYAWLCAFAFLVILMVCIFKLWGVVLSRV